MHRIKFLGLAALAALAIASGAPRAAAQLNFYIGVAPHCPYGYYDYAPHNCAPDGYYGPEWFIGGVFIGAGAWFHGPNDFQGLVDNTLDPQYGYSGPLPKAGDKPAAQRRAAERFKGNEVRDGHGNIRGEIPSSKGNG
jgi:hypothetical protein